MIDYHIHTGYTHDVKKSTLEDYGKRAEELKISEMLFTNHFIIIWQNKPESTLKIEQIEEHFKEVEKLRENFNLKIKVGLEVDFFEGREREIEKVAENYPFDLILGSVHFLNENILIEDSSLYKKYSQLEIYRKYFLKLKLATESQIFDVIAHPDFIRRYGAKYCKKDLPFEAYKAEIESLVESLVENKVGIELNTSGLRHGIKDFYPSLDFLKICREKRVKIITIGSDAHSPSQVGFKLEKAVERLKIAKYKKICLFNRRKVKMINLSEL